MKDPRVKTEMEELKNVLCKSVLGLKLGLGREKELLRTTGSPYQMPSKKNVLRSSKPSTSWRSSIVLFHQALYQGPARVLRKPEPGQAERKPELSSPAKPGPAHHLARVAMSAGDVRPDMGGLGRVWGAVCTYPDCGYWVIMGLGRRRFE